MVKPEFKLRKKYNGIFFKGKLYRNGDTTLKEALYLKENHPAGSKLFDIVPEKQARKRNEKS